MLYKYVESDRIDIIENLKIRFTPYDKLNDPYECRFVLNPMESEIEQAKEDENNAEWAMVEVWIHSRIGQLGMLCLSRTPRNLLMWSHYAENHKGFVIGFDEKHQFFKKETYYIEPAYGVKQVLDLQGFGTLRDIVYSQERSTISFNENIPFDSFFRKSLDWSYEQEVRMFRTLQNADTIIDKKIHLFDIPPIAIRKIIIGSQNDDYEKLTETVQQENLQHISIEKAYLHRKNFSLKFQEIYCSK